MLLPPYKPDPPMKHIFTSCGLEIDAHVENYDDTTAYISQSHGLLYLPCSTVTLIVLEMDILLSQSLNLAKGRKMA